MFVPAGQAYEEAVTVILSTSVPYGDYIETRRSVKSVNIQGSKFLKQFMITSWIISLYLKTKLDNANKN